MLISPYSLDGVNTAEEKVFVLLNRKQIEDSPSISTDKPVSHQFESSYNSYYGYPEYWGGPYMWGGYPYIVRDRTRRGLSAKKEIEWDRHLRSTQEVTGYHLLTIDGEIGHVDDFIIDDETWAIRYLVVATKNWWPGKRVLISPKWIESVSWDAREVVIGLTRETIKAAPEYTDESGSRGSTKRACMVTTIVKDTGSTNFRPCESCLTNYEARSIRRFTQVKL